MTSQKPSETLSGGFFVWLTLLCALLYLPGLATLPPIDRDEARFMQATKQMIETGDYAHINFQAEPRDKKPIGAYWAQAAFVNVFGQELTTTWPYRLPSVLGVWLAVIVTAWSVARITTPQTGFIAGAILATTLLTTVEAHLAKADALLLGSSAVVFAGLVQARTQNVSALMRTAFWIALGLGVLIKGPILPAILLLTLIALYAADKSLTWMRTLKPAIGMMIALAVVGIWPLMVGIDEVARFAASAFNQDLLPKIVGGAESHGAPPGLHALMSIATLWPWGFALPFAAVAAWRNRASPIVRLCAAWVIPFWLVLEVTPTKLPHYILPLFPAVALLIAYGLEKLPHLPKRALNVSAWFNGVAFLALGFILLLIGQQLNGIERTLPHYALGTLITVAVLMVGYVPAGLQKWRAQTLCIGVSVAAILFNAGLFGLLSIPSPLHLSSALTTALQPHRDATPVVLAGYSEPSAVFLLGTNTITTNPQHAGELLAAGTARLAAIAESDLAAVDAIVREGGKNLVRLDQISGYNYSRGREVMLIIVSTAP